MQIRDDGGGGWSNNSSFALQSIAQVKDLI